MKQLAGRVILYQQYKTPVSMGLPVMRLYREMIVFMLHPVPLFSHIPKTIYRHSLPVHQKTLVMASKVVTVNISYIYIL